MNNREMINTYVVTNKLHVDFDSISKVTQYHLDRIYEDKVSVRYILDLVVDGVISFKTFATLGASILANLGDVKSCEDTIYYTEHIISNLNRYIDSSHLDRIITNMIYEMNTRICNTYEDMQRILRKACIVNLSENEYIRLNNKKLLVHDISRSSNSLNYFELEGYNDEYIAMIVVKRNNIEIYNSNDVRSQLDKVALLSNMLSNDSFDIWLQAQDENEESLISDIIDSKLVF